MCVSGTINGLGERAGNSVIEEILAYLNNRSCSPLYNTKELKRLSQLVAHYSNRILPGTKPVTGDHV